MRVPLKSSPCVAILGVALLAVGCEGGQAGSPTERLWVSGLPSNPKAPITAFATTRTSSDKYIGAFFQGSMLRGGHDVFEWRSEGQDAATLKFLQDGETRRVRFETCKPTRGFDYCIVLHGDPTGTGRYQSRKRWTVRRPGRRRDAGATLVTDVMFELSEDDGQLRVAFEATGP